MHFDNTAYFLGETIWFSAYVTRCDKDSLTDMSGVLYAELLSPEGEILDTKKMKLDSGRADGSFSLMKYKQSGYYEVRAYTRYSTNWGADGYYSRVFPIFGSPDKEGDYKTNLSIADNSYANRKQIAGKSPSFGDACELTVDSTQKEDIVITVTPRTATDDIAAIFITRGGNVELFDTLRLAGKSSQIYLGKSDLPEGIHQISIVNAGGDILARGVLPVNKGNAIKRIEVEALDKQASPYGLVRFRLKSKPNTRFSLSVRDYDTEVNGEGEGIEAWITGAGLPDIADMTGKNEFQVNQPIEDGLYVDGRLKYGDKPVKEHVKLVASLYNSMGQMIKGEGETTEEGAFSFSVPECEGSWTMLLETDQGESKKRKDYRIGLNRRFSPPVRTFGSDETTLRPVDTGCITLEPAAGDDLKALGIDEKTHMIGEVKVDGKRAFEDARKAWENETYGAYRADIYYNCDDATDAYYDEGREIPGIFDWLKEKNNNFGGSSNYMTETLSPQELSDQHQDIPQKWRDDLVQYSDLRSDDDNSGAKLADGRAINMHEKQRIVENFKQEIKAGHHLDLSDGLNYKSRPIVWILNNNFYYVTRMPGSIGIKDITEIHKQGIEQMPVSLENFKSVYISSDDDQWKQFVEIPKLSKPITIYLYTHHYIADTKKGSRRTSYQGYSRKLTFPAPDYSVKPSMKDYRRTLYWNPSVTTDENGEAVIEFYNSTYCNKFVFSAEGIESDGTVATNHF